ncbi:MAG: FHA domain-containing protein [Blastocatellia bacterium]|nr:FHA domain-containing protein [Blastocatellia bacterium]
MPADKPNWENEEQTILTFDVINQPPAKEDEQQAADSSAVDEEETILRKSSTTAEADEDETILGKPSTIAAAFDDRTIAAQGAPPAERVEVISWLVITRTPSVRKGQIFTLDKVRNDIGRGEGVQVFLNDPAISRSHATVKYEISPDGSDGRFVLYDLASTRGTFLNGRRVSSPTVLKDGDRITLGDTEIAFKQL